MIFESLEKDKQEQIREYLEEVIEKNKTLNLTRIDTQEKGITLHVEDSLSCLDEFMMDTGEFLDIGTGGGFPGVPLAIASGRSGMLIDSVQKKARAVAEIVKCMGLDQQIEVRGIRSEELAREVGERFETVIARAVTSLPSLLELACPLLKSGGHMIALRGHEDIYSISEAESTASLLGMKLVSQRELIIDDIYKRTICVFEKIGEPSVSLPRRNGMAQKRPLR